MLKKITALLSAVLVSLVFFTACTTDNKQKVIKENSSEHIEKNQSESTQQDSSKSNTNNTNFNTEDIMFAQMIVAHNEQALEISEIFLATANTSPEVTKIAENIKNNQVPEIEELNNWLKKWGVSDYDISDMRDSVGDILSEQGIEELPNVQGPAADSSYLIQMIAHHETSINMAETVILNGKNDEIKKVAEKIIQHQTEEIKSMEELISF